MRETYIVTTQKADMHALSYQGIKAPDSFAQLEDLVRRRLGEEHARLLAKPVPIRPQGGSNRPPSVDWYSTAQGQVQRLLDLSPEEQRPLRERFRDVARHIGALADELAQAPENAKKIRGNIMLLSLLCPGEEALYAVGGQPVCVNWGHGPGAVGVDPLDLRELPLSPPEPPPLPEEPEVVVAPPPTPEPPPPPPTPEAPPPPPTPEAPPVTPPPEAPLAAPIAETTPIADAALFGAQEQAAPPPAPPPPPPAQEDEPPRRRFRPNWWWLLPAALAVVAGFMLMLRMGYPSLQSVLHFKEPTEAQGKRERERQLNEALPALWAKLEERAGECKVHSGRPGRKPPAPGATPPAPTDPPKTEPPKTDPPTTPPPPTEPPPTEPPPTDPAPTTPPADPPPTDPPKPGPAMKIPPKPKNLAFLQGRWRCESGLVSARDGKPIVFEFRFDGRGNGTVTILQQDGSRCTGAAQGSLVRGGLHMETTGQMCPSPPHFARGTIDCANQGAAAQCRGKHPSGKTWSCAFTKIE